jgi:hypothetical protein
MLQLTYWIGDKDPYNYPNWTPFLLYVCYRTWNILIYGKPHIKTWILNMYAVIVLNIDSLNFLILVPNLCILWINLDLQIFIKSNDVYSSLFWINLGISRPSWRTW